MKISITMIVHLFLLGLLLSCNKHTPEQNTPYDKYFANNVGNYWEYDVYDSSSVRVHSDYPRAYTVKVIISGIQKLVDGKDATVWEYQYPWGNDTNYVRLVGDTVKIFDRVYSRSIEDLNFPRQIFLLPFEISKRWDGKLLYIDTSRVIRQEDVTVPAQTFTNCFDLFRHYLGPNLEYNDSYWFKPNIGMVKIYLHEYNLGPVTIELWRLKRSVLR